MGQAPAIIPNLPEIIARYAHGEDQQALSDELGVHRVTLYRHMLAALGDDAFHDLITYSLVNRIAAADHDLHHAEGMSNVARSAHEARYARMDFERRRPHLYGPKQEMNIDKKVVVHIHREQAKPQAVDVQSTSSEVVTPSCKLVDTDTHVIIEDHAH